MSNTLSLPAHLIRAGVSSGLLSTNPHSMCGFHQPRLLRLLFCLAMAMQGGRTFAQHEFETWDMEDRLSKAHLVMVVRVATVGELTVVEGAKADLELRSFRFEPVRRLKGLFQRDELSMTATDLGCPVDDEPTGPALQEGEFRLLILSQPQGISEFTCVSPTAGTTTFNERVPLLNGPDDPLISVVETLIRITDSRSRREKTQWLTEHLTTTSGIAAIPLMTAIQRRSDLASENAEIYARLARLTADTHPAASYCALETLRQVLANRNTPLTVDTVALLNEALRTLSEQHPSRTSQRLNVIESIGYVLVHDSNPSWAINYLIGRTGDGSTYVERSKAAWALSHTGDPRAAEPVMRILRQMPLDEQVTHELTISKAALQLNREVAEDILVKRLQHSASAQEGVQVEIELLSSQQNPACFQILLKLSQAVNSNQEMTYAVVRGLAKYQNDAAIQYLIRALRSEDHQLSEFALTALEYIDSAKAATEVQTTLNSEPHLPHKLRIARLMARHGLNDGYDIAAQHLADEAHFATATLVIAELRDPRTITDLSTILTSQPDRRWETAALTGLAALGEASARNQLLQILADDRDPRILRAVQAAGLVDSPELIEPLSRLILSRNKLLAMTSLMSISSYLRDVRHSPKGLIMPERIALEDVAVATQIVRLPSAVRESIASAAGELVRDPFADLSLRQQAFEIARLVRGESFEELLSLLADQAELEGSPLLQQVQSERHRLRGN